MKISQFICLTFSILVSFNSMAEKCDENRKKLMIKKISLLRNKITANYRTKGYRTKDVENDVSRLISYLKVCDSVKISHFGSNKQVSNLLLKVEAKKWKSKIEYNSNFYLPKKAIQEYLKFTLKAGKGNESKINAFIESHKKKGKRSFKTEKNNCTPIDLRNAKLGKVRDQGFVGWCYAFVVADLLSYKIGKKISATGVAFAYNNAYRSKHDKSLLDFLLFRDGRVKYEFEVDSGEIDRAIYSAIEHGLCLEKELPSEDVYYGNLYFVIKDIEKYKFENDCNSHGATCRDNHYNHFGRASTLFKELNIDDFIKVFESSLDHNYLDNLAEHSCSKLKPTSKIKVQTYFSKHNTNDRLKMFQKIDSQLNKGTPLAIGYNAAILENKDFLNDSKRTYSPIADKENLHASIIVGRKFNESNGECEYLIRNTYGRVCLFYDGRYKCEEGNIWIPKSSLVRVTQEAVYIE